MFAIYCTWIFIANDLKSNLFLPFFFELGKREIKKDGCSTVMFVCLSSWFPGSWAPLPTSVAGHLIHEHLSLSLGASLSVPIAVPLIFVSLRVSFCDTLSASPSLCLSLSVLGTFFLLFSSAGPFLPMTLLLFLSISHYHHYIQRLGPFIVVNTAFLPVLSERELRILSLAGNPGFPEEERPSLPRGLA